MRRGSAIESERRSPPTLGWSTRLSQISMRAIDRRVLRRFSFLDSFELRVLLWPFLEPLAMRLFRSLLSKRSKGWANQRKRPSTLHGMNSTLRFAERHVAFWARQQDHLALLALNAATTAALSRLWRMKSRNSPIAGVVHAVQSESANTGRAIEESATSVSIGLERPKEADVALGEITHTSQEAGARIEEIVSSVRMQSRDAENVVSLMQRVSDESAAIEAAMGEQSRGNQFILDATGGMRELTEQLKRTIASQASGGGQCARSHRGRRLLGRRHRSSPRGAGGSLRFCC